MQFYRVLAGNEFGKKQRDERKDASAEIDRSRWRLMLHEVFLFMSSVGSVCESATHSVLLFNVAFIVHLSDACSLNDIGSTNKYFSYCQQIP